MINKISVNEHSSICIKDKLTLYFDPFRIQNESHDADIIFITHSHFDHYSLEDIKKIINENTVLVFPKSMENEVNGNGLNNQFIFFDVYEEKEIKSYKVQAVPSYNIGKPMHPKENKWVGYIVEIDSQKVYVCGDTDDISEKENLKCDIVLIPVGGYYTMSAFEAANFVRNIKPEVAIPTHYGTLVGEKTYGDEFESFVDSNIIVVKKIKF